MIARIRDIALIVMASAFTLMCLVVIVIAILLYSPLRQTVGTLNDTAAALKGVAESVEGTVSNVEATMDNIRQGVGERRRRRGQNCAGGSQAGRR